MRANALPLSTSQRPHQRISGSAACLMTGHPFVIKAGVIEAGVMKASADAAASGVEQNSEFTAQISVQFSRQMRWMKIIQYLLFALYRGFYKIWFI